MKRLLITLVLFFSWPLSALAQNWAELVPADICAAALAPEQVLDEKPCDWRAVLAPLFQPLVKDCRSAREATLIIASRLGELTGVRYDIGRRHPCMNAQEALAEKKVSCTGQSILLVCALRSVGIPARAVGVETWNHVPGNHTWVEAWFEGGWHMVEANEKDFNTPWVMEAIGMLNPTSQPQRILAVHPSGKCRFPTVWSRQRAVPAENVSERYYALARQWYTRNGVPEGIQKLMVDVHPRPFVPRAIVLEDEAGRQLSRAYLPTPRDDVRQFATLFLPRSLTCYLRIEGSTLRTPLKANQAPVQIIRLKAAGS